MSDEATKKKYLKKLEKLAFRLEDANYHNEVGVVSYLMDVYENDKLKTVEDVFDHLIKNPEWKRL